MKRIVCPLFFLVISLLSITANAQRCGSMEVLQQQLQADPNLAAVRQQIENQTNQFLANPQNRGSRAVITIPVVVHVVYNTTAQNVSTAQIQSQIDRLNLDYRKLNTDWTRTPAVWQSLVADYEIEFCLATRDPNGNTTTGIIRKQTSTTSFSTNDNVKRAANGGDDAWPASSYLNLWVCNLSGGILGYAQFPGGAAATDGVVINYTAFGTGGTAQSPYNLGRTATHEVGHWLNLYHIWGDDGSGCTGSDQVGDTPNQGAQHYGCPTGAQVSCSNGPNGDMYMNYMDYTDDACMYMFTNGQKARSLALFATGGARVGLLSSLGCQPNNTPPIANFLADVTNSCTGLIKFTDLTTNGATSWSWNFGDGQTATTQNPTHQYTANGVYTVTLTATNAYGNNSKTLTNYITVSKPAAPAASNVSRCGPGTLTLTTSSTNPVAWFDSLGNKVGSTANYTTPVLTRTTTYFVQDTVPGSTYNVGKANNSGSGGYLTQTGSNWATIFNVNKPCVLQSVYVYAGAAGNRTIEVRNSGGTLLNTLTTNLPAGGSRVTLNFSLAAGTGYTLSLSDNSVINLYRNNAGAAYPYTDGGGYVSITGNDAPNATAYYYFFYDWIIQGGGCVSERRAVTATISSGLTVSATASSASCGSNNGSVTATVSGGTPAYTYQWSSGGTGASVTNLVSGTYTVTVNDINACTGTATATVSSQANLTSVKAFTNVTCNGGNNGTAGVTVSNGTPNYTYAWSNLQNTASVSGLAAGSYLVTITDGNNCVKVDSFTITQPAPINLTVTANDTRCNGEASGQATAAATGGNGSFNFNWSNSQSGASITNLTAGNYAVTVSDLRGCRDTALFVVNEPAAITTNTTVTNITCFGLTDGRANVVATGGTGNFTYQWCNNVTTHNTANLSAGTCSVTVTDDNGCTAADNVAVQQPAQITATVSASSASCFGGNDGSASVNAAGGTGSLAYQWCNNASAATATGLSAGPCGVTVTDDNGCSVSNSVTIQQPAQIVATVTSVNATCAGGNNGSATVSVTGGVGNLAYQWCNGATTATALNLGPGACAVTVTDAGGCSVVSSVNVQQTGRPATTVSSTGVSCFGSADGSASVAVSGGSGNVTYLWCNGSTTANAANLSGGNCVVTVTDVNGCTVTDTAVIVQPGQLTASVTPVDVSCFGANTGQANVTTTGGTGNLTYQWCNGATTATATNLSAGNCSVTVTDSKGCTASSNVTIQQPAAVTTSVSAAAAATCFGTRDGQASIVANGGDGNFTYQWCNGATTANVTNLGAGVCTVTVTDGNGCSASANVTIQQPAQMVTAVSSTNNSVAVDTVYGGSGPFTYVWSTGDTTKSIGGLAPGSYLVTITDNNGCTVAAGVTLTGTGIANIGAGVQFTMYPNPATDEVIVSLSNWSDKATLVIYNVVGQPVMHQNITAQQTPLNLKTLNSGVYLVEVRTGEARMLKQLVISK